MTLHLNEAEREAYRKEKQRQHNAAYRQRQSDKVWLREQRYREIEQRIAEVHEENERLKSGYQRLKDQYDELKNGPPKERIVTETVLEQVPTLMHVGNIAAVLKLCREAEPHWVESLWAELGPVLKSKGISWAKD